jgi:hypothetical protein
MADDFQCRRMLAKDNQVPELCPVQIRDLPSVSELLRPGYSAASGRPKVGGHCTSRFLNQSAKEKI